MTRPLANAAPRFTTSQQATPCDADDGLGLYDHLVGVPGFVRSRAYRMFGYGVTTYMVLLTTSGAASCPRSMPVENVVVSVSRAAFPVVICRSPLYRVLA